MKLIQKDGVVEFVMRSDNDLVKNTMPLKTAQKIISKGSAKTVSPIADEYTLCVDDKFFFEVKNEQTEPLSTVTQKKRKKSTESE